MNKEQIKQEQNKLLSSNKCRIYLIVGKLDKNGFSKTESISYEHFRKRGLPTSD